MTAFVADSPCFDRVRLTVFNPLLANVFAGNALVVKVSEYASWSSLYYGRAIKACLKAVIQSEIRRGLARFRI